MVSCSKRSQRTELYFSNISRFVSPAKMKWKVPLYVGIPPARRHGHTAFILHSHVSVPLNRFKLYNLFIIVMSYNIKYNLFGDSSMYLEGRMKSRSLMTWRWWNSLTPQRDNQVHYSCLFYFKITLIRQSIRTICEFFLINLQL